MTDTIYLHGAGLNAQSWEDIPGHPLNLPGHGDRPRAARPRVAAMADALAPEIPANAALVGHSLGGMVAMDLAARPSLNIRALVLVDTPLTIRALGVKSLGPKLAPWIVRALGPRMIGKLVSYRVETVAKRREFQHWIAANDPASLSDAMVAAALFDGEDLMHRISGAKIPVLAIFGKTSFLTRPPSCADMKAACPQVDFVTFDTGHMIPQDRPVEMQVAINRFLESHS